MSQAPVFTLRPPEGKPSETLDGEFRVQLNAEDMKLLGLNPGDYCRLKSTAGDSTGVGIAWRSVQSTPRRIIKISHCFKDAYDFKIGEKVSLSRYDGKLRHVQSVTVQEVSLDVSGTPIPRKILDSTIANTLYGIEVLWPGGHFDIVPRVDGQRYRKRRFVVDTIDSVGDGLTPIPYAFDFSSNVKVRDGIPSPTEPSSDDGDSLEKPIQIASKDIGGLDRQLELLNSHIRSARHLLNRNRQREVLVAFLKPCHVLLHGSPGTGKSLVLEKLKEENAAAIVLDIDETFQGVRQHGPLLSDVFAQAVSQQPSIVVIDNLDRISRKGEDTKYTASLRREMRKLHRSQVTVVAAARNPNDIDASLRALFSFEIELPIPNLAARKHILRVLLKSVDGYFSESTLETTGEMTHGYVGQDLAQLCDAAVRIALERLCEHDLRHHVAETANATVQAISKPSTRVSDSSQASESPHPGHSGNESDDAILTSDFQAAMRQIRPSAMREVILETPRVLWEDIGGSDEIRAELSKAVEFPFEHPDIMAEYGLRPPRGVLLYGPPGCSKTLTAKAVATSSGLNFLAVKGAELTSMYVGETERNIREIFRKARRASPSVIFFDEFDAIASSRGAAGHGETPGLNVITTLLNEMDGIESLGSVLILAATNHPEILDPALLRPGRFDPLLYVAPPNAVARRQIFEINTRLKVFGDIDLDQLARKTEGYSGADIVKVCSNAADTAAYRKVEKMKRGMACNDVESVTMADFENAMGKPSITAETIERYERWRHSRAEQ